MSEEKLDNELPARVLEDVAWAFKGNVWSDFEEFSNFAKSYQQRIAGIENWDANQPVLHVPRIQVVYRCHPFDDSKVVGLESDSGKSFTSGELLFKLHNAVVEELRDRDHRYFEGLKLNSHPVAGHPAIYFLRTGS